MSNPFDLVVLDLGGVLIRHARSWEEMHERAGLDGDPPSGDDWHRGWTNIEKLLETGAIDLDVGHRRMAAASRGRYRPEDIEHARAASLIAQYPGVDAVFDALDALSLETALLGNLTASDWSRLGLEPAAAEREFAVVLRARHRYASHLIGARKPDRAAFEAVERGTGHDPARILFFDDRPANVEGARTAGWTAELVDHAGDTAEQMLAALRSHGVIE